MIFLKLINTDLKYQYMLYLLVGVKFCIGVLVKLSIYIYNTKSNF